MSNKGWILFVVMLLGCQANDNSLEDFVAKTEANVEVEVDKLKPTQSFHVMPFLSHPEGSPFELPQLAQAQTPAFSEVCWQPKIRVKGRLEQYRLNELHLKGIMSKGEALTGLLLLPNRQLVKVRKGQYVGENNGKIKQVTAEGLVVSETLSDGLGCWFQRQVKLTLN
ncbi:pilus assembly protein PilP [Vibrio sp. 10N.261.51.F12]|uniref:pilus assembly protein PilP n=1 Tax=Vibrio sp. 10N.261.51.F12 TaxID=3229679 RepID=UPI00354FFC6A